MKSEDKSFTIIAVIFIVLVFVWNVIDDFNDTSVKLAQLECVERIVKNETH